MTDAFEPVPDPWPQPVPPPARTRTNFWHLLLAGAAGAALVGALWVGLDLARTGSPSAPAVTAAQSFDLSGTFTLYSTGYGYSTCGGSGGYSDITTGTAVTVYDAAGTVLSQGALGTGHSNGAGTCVFSLPDDARYGRVAISLGN